MSVGERYAVTEPGEWPARHRVLRAVASRPAAIHLAVLCCYLAAGIAETWPRVTDLAGRLPATTDAESYVWDFWWVARQVTHLHDPWSTGYMAAPAGIRLGFDILMPLPGLVMTPVTAVFGASTSFTLLTIVIPGLLCYVVYRAARLWVASQAGAIAAGALFGLCTMLTWEAGLHLNIAVGELFLPMALEASVRLRRRPGRRQAVILGLVLGAAVLVNQESAVLAAIVTAAALLPWLPGRPRLPRLRPAALAAGVAALTASPQLVAMIQQMRAGGAAGPATLAHWDSRFGVAPATLFSPSPRVASFGLTRVAAIYHYAQPGEGRPTFGLVLTVLAVAGLVISRRRRAAWAMAVLWIGSAALALGPVLLIGNNTYAPLAVLRHGVRMSALLPYTWLIQIPGLAAFREADRFALLGLVPAALLAGSAVDWLTRHARLLIIPVFALAVLEAGWSSGGGMPATLPALDNPIAADHSGSIVVDVPFGLRGGLPDYGAPIAPQPLVLATADGHPRAISYTAWVPAVTIAGIRRHPFYQRLLATQDGQRSSAAQLAAARSDARAMNVGWVLVWRQVPGVTGYLLRTGFRFGYRADGVAVYRLGAGATAR